jgi:hypothetical protein
MTEQQLHLFTIEPLRGTTPLATICLECGIDCSAADETYMVKDTVWPIGDLDGMLCVGCIEQRIGRRLTPRTSPTRRRTGCHSRAAGTAPASPTA